MTEPAFRRFPIWMWRNAEVHEFIEWLRAYNAPRAAERRAGFFGLYIYNLNASTHAVIDYLDRVAPDAAPVARERYGCLTPWQRDPATYGRAAISAGYAKCEVAVVAMLRDLLDKRIEHSRRDDEGFFDAVQNARPVSSAERYCRVIYHGGGKILEPARRHMFETLEQLLAGHGKTTKAAVWAHNSHVGNAAATDMGAICGEINIGQLCRERFGGDAVLIGFGTDCGTVAAASDWDGPMEIKQVRPAHPDSHGQLCRDSDVGLTPQPTTPLEGVPENSPFGL